MDLLLKGGSHFCGVKGIRDKIHAPALVDCARFCTTRPAGASLGAFDPKVQAFLAIEPVDALVVHSPALSPQKNVNPLISVSDAGSGEFLDPHPESSRRIRYTLVALVRAREGKRLAGSTLAHPEAFLEKKSPGGASAQAPEFFWMTS